MTLRVFIAVTHLLGAGHLTRAAAIARVLAASGHAVTLASGGRPTAILPGGRYRLIQLPPLQGRVDDFTTMRVEDGAEVGPDYLARRRALLLGALAEQRPDILVTELFPFGRRALAGEFTALLEAAQSLTPRPLVACSVRDILVAPGTPEKADRTHRLLARFYDAVLVHGDPALLPLEASWPPAQRVPVPLAYTGYIDTERQPEPGPENGEILVSGGSSEAGLPLYRAAIGAAALIPDRPWRILLGRGVGARAHEEAAAGAPANVTIEPARSDFRDLMARAALFVGQAGYNTAVDLLATRPRAILIPFETGRETEQRLRAEKLAEHDLASVLPEAELSPDRLAGAVRTALARPRPKPAGISRDGGRRTVEALLELARRAR